MASSSGTNEAGVVSIQEGTLVRRFTDSLNGDTPLEEATISAQSEDDRILQESDERRLRRLYEDNVRNPSESDFSAASIARTALEFACQKFEQEMKPSKLSKFGIKRKSARATANELLQQNIAEDFDGLQNLVNQLECQWDDSHGPIYKNFQRVCETLDSHKKVFAIFPQQNMYCSVLVGSLSLFVSAAVNHSTVAEVISSTIAEVSEKAARCAELLQAMTTSSMRKLLSELYSQVFRFYRDAMEWYLASKTSTFFGSFNEKLKDRFEKAARNIENCVVEMYRESHVSMLKLLWVMHSTTTETKNEVFRQRQQSYREEELATAGRSMFDMFKAILQHELSDQQSIVQTLDLGAPRLRLDDAHGIAANLKRAQARSQTSRMEKFVVGTEGYSLFGDGKFWVPENDATSRLQDWSSADGTSSILWISSQSVSPGPSNAQAAAMTAVAAAWQSSLPIISHFCERPRPSRNPGDRSAEQTGLIGLVYSLIVQLLQFEFDGDLFNITDEEANALDGSTGSWSTSLSVMTRLLETTPHLSLCVIHGLNDLAWAGGADWCHSLLQRLFDHQKKLAGRFKILLTTSGQSRVLPDYVSPKDRFFSQKASRQILRLSRPTGHG